MNILYISKTFYKRGPLTKGTMSLCHIKAWKEGWWLMRVYWRVCGLGMEEEGRMD